jgi:RND family efflux transporter MFP subunit
VLNHRLTATCASALLSLTLLAGCGGGSKPVEASPLATVETATVAPPNGGQSLNVTGALRRQREMVLSFRIPGVITGLNVDEGDEVKAGQVLARLDPTTVDSRLRQAAADLDRARKDEARYGKLADAGIVSRQRAEAQSAAAASAQAAYDGAAFDRRWANLVAPSKGVILTRNAQAGEVVQPGQAVLSLADEASPLVLRVPLSDRDIGKIRIGSSAQITLDALPGQSITGSVSRIGQRAGAQSGAIDVEITLPASPGLRSGLIASAKIAATGPATVSANSLFSRIPAEAIMEADGKKASVLRFDPKDNMVRQTQVVFGGFDGDDALVQGLAPGTRVITAGAGFVTNGQKVQVTDPATIGSAR